MDLCILTSFPDIAPPTSIQQSQQSAIIPRHDSIIPRHDPFQVGSQKVSKQHSAKSADMIPLFPDIIPRHDPFPDMIRSQTWSVPRHDPFQVSNQRADRIFQHNTIPVLFNHFNGLILIDWLSTYLTVVWGHGLLSGKPDWYPGCCLGDLTVGMAWLEWLYLGTARFLEPLNFEMVNHYPVNHWM